MASSSFAARDRDQLRNGKADSASARHSATNTWPMSSPRRPACAVALLATPRAPGLGGAVRNIRHHCAVLCTAALLAACASGGNRVSSRP